MHEWYSSQLHIIFDEFRDVIAGSFFGHTHMDEVEVVRDVATDTVPIGIAFVAPSVTPQTNINPSFRIYTYNRTSFEVLDYQQFTINLTDCNIKGSIDWQLIYSPLAAYGMTALTPSDWQDMVNRLTTNTTLLQLYTAHHFTEVPLGCDKDCEKDLICSAASFTPSLYEQCMNQTSTIPPSVAIV
jgi:hypothetical protein